MTPARFAVLRALVCLSEREVARLTGYSPGAVRNWSLGTAQVWPPFAAWLERQAAQWRENPPPRRPKIRKEGSTP